MTFLTELDAFKSERLAPLFSSGTLAIDGAADGMSGFSPLADEYVPRPTRMTLAV